MSVQQSTFPAISDLRDLIDQKTILDQYPWISSKMLGRWRSEGRLRAIRGKDEIAVYPICDLKSVLNHELNLCVINNPDYLSIEATGSQPSPTEMGSTVVGMMQESEKLAANLSDQRFLKRQKKN